MTKRVKRGFYTVINIKGTGKKSLNCKEIKNVIRKLKSMLEAVQIRMISSVKQPLMWKTSFNNSPRIQRIRTKRRNYQKEKDRCERQGTEVQPLEKSVFQEENKLNRSRNRKQWYKTLLR